MEIVGVLASPSVIVTDVPAMDNTAEATRRIWA
jgi:hypothetical protein